MHKGGLLKAFNEVKFVLKNYLPWPSQHSPLSSRQHRGIKTTHIKSASKVPENGKNEGAKQEEEQNHFKLL